MNNNWINFTTRLIVVEYVVTSNLLPRSRNEDISHSQRRQKVHLHEKCCEECPFQYSNLLPPIPVTMFDIDICIIVFPTRCSYDAICHRYIHRTIYYVCMYGIIYYRYRYDTISIFFRNIVLYYLGIIIPFLLYCIWITCIIKYFDESFELYYPMWTLRYFNSILHVQQYYLTFIFSPASALVHI